MAGTDRRADLCDSAGRRYFSDLVDEVNRIGIGQICAVSSNLLYLVLYINNILESFGLTRYA